MIKDYKDYKLVLEAISKFQKEILKNKKQLIELDKKEKSLNLNNYKVVLERTIIEYEKEIEELNKLIIEYERTN